MQLVFPARAGYTYLTHTVRTQIGKDCSAIIVSREGNGTVQHQVFTTVQSMQLP